MNENIDARLDYPATSRNQKAILDVLKGALPSSGTILEVASGSGQHITYFAQKIPQLKWQPSDPEIVARASIEAWRIKLGVTDSVYPPLNLDARSAIWPLAHIKDLNAILSINMIHISPWDACLGLLENANQILLPGGVLYLYGPFKVGGVHTAQSNADFDLSLQSQDPSWAVRNLDEVAEEAMNQNFQLMKTVRMPSNNLSVIFHKKD
jgi:SAM-dependent methyltransferase